MKRRNFLRRFLAMPAVLLIRQLPAVASPTAAVSQPLVLQRSPLAGFQYHSGPSIWSLLRIGQPLSLVREPQNRYDTRAVAVYWCDCKLGYVPRGENTTVAQMLDRAEQQLQARIVRLEEDSNPWNRVELQIDAVI